MRAWNIPWSSRSPSSSRRWTRSPVSTASITSWLSSSRYGRREAWVWRASQGQPPGARTRAAGAPAGGAQPVDDGDEVEQPGTGDVVRARDELDLGRCPGDGPAGELLG